MTNSVRPGLAATTAWPRTGVTAGSPASRRACAPEQLTTTRAPASRAAPASSRSAVRVAPRHRVARSLVSTRCGPQIAPATAEVVSGGSRSARTSTLWPASARHTAVVRPETPAPTTSASGPGRGMASPPERLGGDLADHDPLDLAGGGLRQALQHQHLPGPLERGQALPAERDELVALHRPARHRHHARDDLLQAVGVPVAHHRAFGHRLVLDEAGLHLGRRHPDA